QRNDLVDVRQRDGQTFEHVTALARLAQVEARAPHDHFAPVRDEMLEELLEVQQSRLDIDQRDHVHPEAVLKLRQLVQVVLDDLRHFAAFELDDDAHARLVGFVAQVGNALELLFAYELADAHEQVRLVYLVGNLVDDDRLAIALVEVLEMRAGAHYYATAAGPIAFANAFQPVNDSRRRKVGRRDDFHQLIDGEPGTGEERQAGVDGFGQVVRRDVRRHADRDARRAVDEQVRQPRRQHCGFLLLAVVIGHEIDGFLVDVRE